jgi:uncharacterized protein YkwD
MHQSRLCRQLRDWKRHRWFLPVTVGSLVFLVVCITSVFSDASGVAVYGEWIRPKSLLWLVTGKGKDIPVKKREDIRLSDSSRELHVKGDNYSIAHLGFTNDSRSVRFVQAGPSPSKSVYQYPCRVPGKGLYTIGWTQGGRMMPCAIQVRKEDLQYKSKSEGSDQPESPINSDEVIVAPASNKPTLIQIYDSGGVVVIDVLLGEITVSPVEKTGANLKSLPVGARNFRAGRRLLFQEKDVEVKNLRPQIPEIIKSSTLETFFQTDNWLQNSVTPLKDLQAALNRPSDMSYLSQMEQQVIAEINEVRANPSAYAAKLEALKPYFDGKLLKLPGKIALKTKEGVSAVEEAIQVLRATNPLPPLDPSKGLSLAAKDHVKDQGAKGGIGHLGSDGSNSSIRIARYGYSQGGIAENISYVSDTAEAVVQALIIDDGTPSRGHRNNLLNPRYQLIGVGCGAHRELRVMCVLDLAGSYTEKDEIANQ